MGQVGGPYENEEYDDEEDVQDVADDAEPGVELEGVNAE
jgi:hypothetical protein